MLLLYSYNLCFKLLVPLISIPSLIKLSIYSSYYTVFRRKVYLNKQMKQLFTRCETGLKSSPKPRYSACFQTLYLPTMYVYCIYIYIPKSCLHQHHTSCPSPPLLRNLDIEKCRTISPKHITVNKSFNKYV
jgi:hypothetical protein